MFIGILCALCAGLMWGLVFVTPLLLNDYPGVVLSLGRYVAFGLIALVPAWFDRRRIGLLSRQDWKTAFKLALVGNLLYYAMLATAIQLADAPLPTMLIGTLPIVISVCANWRPGHASESVAWRRLAPSLVILCMGLMLVNSSELEHLRNGIGSLGNTRRTTADYILGCIIAVFAIAGWTWYPIVNSRYLRTHRDINSVTWATAQGLATLPMALAGFALYGIYGYAAGDNFAFPLGPRPGIFVAMMLTIGLSASWMGTLLWNKASQLLPTALVAQLIVFETLAALLYAFLLRGTAPDMKVLAGIALLCVGVVYGVQTFSRQTSISHSP
ncbi:DMT family transporter [Herbaspirillum sp. RV1423]|uniref:DMT family transporter n=1 Tax=Herbaspirillum sp. RV1423 TaxID=1443993 RepID=UPI0004B4CC4D|nr:DMT family transporter [Herbaspirillum sp. RV1423]